MLHEALTQLFCYSIFHNSHCRRCRIIDCSTFVFSFITFIIIYTIFRQCLLLSQHVEIDSPHCLAAGAVTRFSLTVFLSFLYLFLFTSFLSLLFITLSPVNVFAATTSSEPKIAPSQLCHLRIVLCLHFYIPCLEFLFL